MWPWRSWVRAPLLTPLFCCRNAGSLGCRQAARHGTLTPAFARFESCHPSHFDPLAQLVEHLTFNQGAWGSNPQWVTILLGLRVWRNGRRGRFRICCPQAYEFESLHPHQFLCGSSSVVECHLAKVDVASPNLVYRSNRRHGQVVRQSSAKASLSSSSLDGASTK